MQLAQQIQEIMQQKEALEKENENLQAQLQQATQDTTALIALVEKLHKKEKRQKVKGEKTRSQLDYLSRVVNAIAKGNEFLEEKDDNM